MKGELHDAREDCDGALHVSHSRLTSNTHTESWWILAGKQLDSLLVWLDGLVLFQQRQKEITHKIRLITPAGGYY